MKSIFLSLFIIISNISLAGKKEEAELKNAIETNNAGEILRLMNDPSLKETAKEKIESNDSSDLEKSIYSFIIEDENSFIKYQNSIDIIWGKYFIFALCKKDYLPSIYFTLLRHLKTLYSSPQSDFFESLYTKNKEKLKTLLLDNSFQEYEFLFSVLLLRDKLFTELITDGGKHPEEFDNLGHNTPSYNDFLKLLAAASIYTNTSACKECMVFDALRGRVVLPREYNPLVKQHEDFGKFLKGKKIKDNRDIGYYVWIWKTSAVRYSTKNFPIETKISNAGHLNSPENINIINALALIAPKSIVPIKVYRGTSCRTSQSTSMISWSIWATSFDYRVAKHFSFTNGDCVLEYIIPPGMPLLYLNAIDNTNKAHEDEVILPEFVLDTTGKKLVKNVYTFDKTKPSFIEINRNEGLDSASFYEPQLQHLESFDRLKYSGNESFKDYQKKYRDTVCKLIEHVAYLKNLCDISQFEYQDSPLEFSSTEPLLHPSCNDTPFLPESCLITLDETNCLKRHQFWGGFRCIHEPKGEATVLEIETLEKNLIHIKAQFQNKDLFFKPGQYTFIKGSENQARAYAFSSSYSEAKDNKIIEFLIKTSKNTENHQYEFTDYFKQLKTGDKIFFDLESYGSFSYKGGQGRNLYIIADSGYAPIHSILKEVLPHETHNKHMLLDTSGVNDTGENILFESIYSKWIDDYHLEALPWKNNSNIHSIIKQFDPKKEDHIYYCGGMITFNAINKILKEAKLESILTSCR